MKDKLISVIMPIYKVEDYLDKCIQSIVSQTYTNLEIILVDDGSPDKCPEICDEWEKKDERIKVYHKKNGGLSDARNYGIERAKGEFLIFVDSDDYLEKDALELLYTNLVNNNADVSVCGMKLYFENNGTFKYYKDYKNDKVILNETGALKMMINEQAGFRVNAINKLYKKELFKEVRYPVNKIYEDVGTTYKTLLQSTKVVYDPSPKYVYVQRNFSITKNLKYDERGLMRIEMATQMYDSVVGKHPNLKNDYTLYLISQYVTMINCMIVSNIYDKKFIKQTKRMIWGNLKNIIFSKQILVKRKCQYLILLISFSLYKKIYQKKGEK